MADLSQITLPNNATYDLKDSTARSLANAVNDQLYSTIAGVAINTTTGAMELWSQNLNNVTATGFYNAMTCTNAKYQYSTLIVIGYYLSGYCLQIQQDVTTGAIATRSQINGTWSAWKAFDIARTIAQSDWNESDTTSEAYIVNKPNLATVATSGSYNDLSNQPTIPSAISDLTNDSDFVSSSTTAKIFVQTTQPSSGMSAGDIWIDTSNLT